MLTQVGNALAIEVDLPHMIVRQVRDLETTAQQRMAVSRCFGAAAGNGTLLRGEPVALPLPRVSGQRDDTPGIGKEGVPFGGASLRIERAERRKHYHPLGLSAP